MLSQKIKSVRERERERERGVKGLVPTIQSNYTTVQSSYTNNLREKKTNP
jgi:hypothetical protein